MSHKRRIVPIWLIVVGVLVIVGLVAYGMARIIIPIRQATQQEPVETGEVVYITAVTSIESSGSLAALQSGEVFWKTSGNVGGVHVLVGDHVEAGDVLLTLDPESAGAEVLNAQANLITARQELYDLLNPTELQIAQAQKTVVDAEQALEEAEQNLTNVQNPAGQSLYDAVADAELALFQAESDLQLANVSSDVQALQDAVAQTNLAFRRLQELQALWDDDVGNQTDELRDQIEQAQANYESALSNQRTLELRIDVDQETQQDTVEKAREDLADAQSNLEAALLGPDPLDLALAEAEVEVARADLAAAQSSLATLLNGPDTQDVAAAQARILAAETVVNALRLTAPFSGQVLAVNYLPGDAIDAQAPAVHLANLSEWRLEVPVDEVEVTQILLGQPATVTLDALPDVSLAGEVSHISPIGEEVQGLVRYNVTVTLRDTHPRLLLGMTANVKIVTEVDEDALAVPLDAVQLDEFGEYVMVYDETTQEQTRVDIVSGLIQEALVIVEGELEPGQRVVLFTPVPTESGSPFG